VVVVLGCFGAERLEKFENFHEKSVVCFGELDLMWHQSRHSRILKSLERFGGADESTKQIAPKKTNNTKKKQSDNLRITTL